MKNILYIRTFKKPTPILDDLDHSGYFSDYFPPQINEHKIPASGIEALLKTVNKFEYTPTTISLEIVNNAIGYSEAFISTMYLRHNLIDNHYKYSTFEIFENLDDLLSYRTALIISESTLKTAMHEWHSAYNITFSEHFYEIEEDDSFTKLNLDLQPLW